MGTTGCPASTSTSTIRPVGRSMAIGMSGAGAKRARLLPSSARPTASWVISTRSTTAPASSTTQTAWPAPPQSNPPKYGMGSPSLVPLRYRESGGPAGRSSIGAPGRTPWRFTLLPVMPSRRPPCGGSHSGRLPASDTGRHGGRSVRAELFTPHAGEKLNQLYGALMSFAAAELSRDGFLDGRIRLWQPRRGYRAAIDPVLLAAFVPARPGQRVLDLGCGAGAAALCLAARVRRPRAARAGAAARLCRAGPAQCRPRTACRSRSTPATCGGRPRRCGGSGSTTCSPTRRSTPPAAAARPMPGRDRAQREADATLEDWIAAGLRRLVPGGRLVAGAPRPTGWGRSWRRWRAGRARSRSCRSRRGPAGPPPGCCCGRARAGPGR